MASFLIRNGLLLAVLLVVPTLLGEFWAYQLGLYYLYAIAALGLGLAWGQSGIISLGQGLFVALGAYLCGYGLLSNGTPVLAYGIVPGAAVITAALAFVIALAVFRGKAESGPSFALITLALTLCGFQIAGSWVSVTGGFNGLRDIPGLPGLDDITSLYYLVAVVLGLCVAAVSWLVHAPVGTLWRAIAENERRLGFLGYDTAVLKAWAFAVSGALAGLAGAIYAPQQNLVTPDLASFGFSGDLLVYTAVGGRTTVLGPVAGALLIGNLTSELRDRFAWWELVIGVLFIVVVLRLPGGLLGFLKPFSDRWTRWPATAPVPAPAKARSGSALTVGFEDVRVRMGEVNVLNGLSFTTGAENVLCIIGPNGAGKTSTLNVLTGALPKRAGRITIDGRTVRRPRPAKVAAVGVGRKFQTPSVFPKLSIGENLAIALWAGRAGSLDLLRPALFAWSTPLLAEMQRRFPFLKETTQPAASLSHGQKQMLELTMALITEPRLLLLDEPCAGLSHEETAAVIDALQCAQRFLDFKVIVIEHDMELVRRIADRVVVLHQGQFLADGSVAAVQANPAVRAVYVGGSR